MPGGLPLELNPEDRALYASIGSMISKGIGADRAYAILRDSGNYMPRSTVRGIAGEIKVALGYRQELAGRNPAHVIPDSLVNYTDAVQRDGFIHRVSMILVDRATGHQFHQWFNYVSDTLASPDRAYRMADQLGGGQDNWYDFDVISRSIVEVSHRLL